MGVPDTTTFTLQDVADEFSLGTNDGLIDCFDEATSADFDPAYSGDKDNLRNFRNYDGTTSLPSFLGSVGTASSVNPCSPPLTMNITYYHNGSGTNPVVGDTVYSDSSGSTTFGGGGVGSTERRFRANISSGGTAVSFGRTANGIIVSVLACGPP